MIPSTHPDHKMDQVDSENKDMIQDTVPVEAAYQVWRVAKVLSMGKVGTHI